MSGFNVTTGANNTFVGISAGYGSTGYYNVGLGTGAGENLTAGNSNVCVGIGTGQNISSASGVTCIGAFVDATNTDNTTWIGNIYGVTTQSGSPHGLSATVHFQYGTTTSYGHTTAIQTQTGNTYRDIVSNIDSLTTHTTYHFRIVATNTGGTRIGADKTFTTP